METTVQLDNLLSYLQKHHPISKPRKLLVSYEEVERLPDVLTGFGTGLAGCYYPLVPTKKLPYHGLIMVATLGMDPLLTLAHEYKHAVQNDQGRIVHTHIYPAELEREAQDFAREVVPQFLASISAN